MAEIASVIAGIFIAWYFYFLKIPIFVCLFVFIINGTLLLMKKKIQIYFIRSDLKVAIFCLPFWGLCTLLPGVQIKSMSNFIEPMILGGIWGLFLFVRLARTYIQSDGFPKRSETGGPYRRVVYGTRHENRPGPPDGRIRGVYMWGAV